MHLFRSFLPKTLACLKRTLVLSALLFQVSSHAANDLQQLKVRARVLFGADGKLEAFEFVHPKAHPKAFLERVQAAVANARLPVQTRDGSPATFKTGIRIGVLVNRSPEDTGFRITYVRMSPILLVEAFPLTGYWDVQRLKSWSVDLMSVYCTVQVSGRCKDILVAGRDLPEAARQFGQESAQAWRFEPQELGDKPVEGQFSALLNLRSVVIH